MRPGAAAAADSPTTSAAAGAGAAAPPPPSQPRAPSVEETIARLSAELAELRREVRDLREAREDDGIATVRGAAQGRRFLSGSRAGDNSGAASPKRRAAAAASDTPPPAIGDAEAAVMAAAVLAGRTGGLAVIDEEGAAGSEVEDAEADGAASGSDSDEDAADVLFDRPDERGPSLRRSPRVRRGWDRSPLPAQSVAVVSPTPEELEGRWHERRDDEWERHRRRLQRQQRQAAAAAAAAERDAESGAARGPPRRAPPLVLPAQTPAAADGSNPGAANRMMTLDEFRALPEAIYLVRHAESMGNADMETYASTPDYEVPLSAVGWRQAVGAGRTLRDALERRHGADGYRCFFYVSPYCRTRQTFVAIREAFEERAFAGLDEDINLREQEFSGGLQTDRIRKDIEDRLRYGRFFFRFPSGESTADVYLRTTVFEAQLLQALRSGHHGDATHLVVIGHGIQLRVLLMRLLGWTVESFLQVHNPPNALPLAIEKVPELAFLRLSSRADRRASLQIRQLYRLSPGARGALRMDTDLSSSTMDLLNQTFT